MSETERKEREEMLERVSLLTVYSILSNYGAKKRTGLVLKLECKKLITLQCPLLLYIVYDYTLALYLQLLLTTKWRLKLGGTVIRKYMVYF